MSAAQQHIIVAAGDLSGYMAGAYLARMLPAGFKITLIRLGKLQAAELYGTAHPDIRRFNKILQINEVDFITSCNAVFRLGLTVCGFGHAPYARTFSQYGLPIDGNGFYESLLANGRSPHPADLAAYNLPAAMIAQGKFAPPADSSKPILSDFDYGYCFDPAGYADMLCKRAAKFGANVITSEDVDIDAMAGRVTLSKGQTLKADLIVDAGARQIHPDWQSWTETMPHTAYAVHRPQTDIHAKRLAPTLKASASALSLSYDLQHSSVEIKFDPSGDNEFQTGRCRVPWTGNVLRLGQSAMTILPLEANLTQIAQIDIERLIELFPPDLGAPIEREEYNRRTSDFYDRMRDFVLLHLKTAKTGGAMWDKARNLKLPKEAGYKLSLFSARGRIAVLDEETTLKDSWHAMLLGHNIVPERAGAMAMNVTPAQLESNLTRLSKFISRAVDAMPSHDDFIARHCPASKRTHE